MPDVCPKDSPGDSSPQTFTSVQLRPQASRGRETRHHCCTRSRIPTRGNSKYKEIVVKLLHFGIICYSQITGPLFRKFINSSFIPPLFIKLLLCGGDSATEEHKIKSLTFQELTV